MYINNVDQMRQFLPSINLSQGLDILNDALIVAEQRIKTMILGDYTSNSESLKDKICRAISLYAFLDSAAELDLSLTDAGFVVADGNGIAPASRTRVEKMINSMTIRYNNAMDDLLCELRNEEHLIWRDSPQGDYLTSGLIIGFDNFCQFKIFSKNINTSLVPLNWTDFYNFIPSLERAYFSFVANYISHSYADVLLETVRDCAPWANNEEKVYRLVCSSIISFALEDEKIGISQAIKARNIMIKNSAFFPAFIDGIKKNDFSNSKIQNFL